MLMQGALTVKRRTLTHTQTGHSMCEFNDEPFYDNRVDKYRRMSSIQCSTIYDNAHVGLIRLSFIWRRCRVQTAWQAKINETFMMKRKWTWKIERMYEGRSKQRSPIHQSINICACVVHHSMYGRAYGIFFLFHLCPPIDWERFANHVCWLTQCPSHLKSLIYMGMPSHSHHQRMFNLPQFVRANLVSWHQVRFLNVLELKIYLHSTFRISYSNRPYPCPMPSNWATKIDTLILCCSSNGKWKFCRRTKAHEFECECKPLTEWQENF